MNEDFEQRVEFAEKSLRSWCAQNDQHVTPAGRVAEGVAAELVDRSAKTLRNWRAQGVGPPYYRAGDQGRVEYRLLDLAEYLEQQLVES